MPSTFAGFGNQSHQEAAAKSACRIRATRRGLRALYNVEGSEVVLLVFGRKVGNKLMVKGEEFYGHQDNPIEPT